MSGIIINDAIVLVTTVRETAARMPIAQAAIAGARDRLRPILLTTLTTGLRLVPLKSEENRQSLFLKLTVITLVCAAIALVFVAIAVALRRTGLSRVSSG